MVKVAIGEVVDYFFEKYCSLGGRGRSEPTSKLQRTFPVGEWAADWGCRFCALRADRVGERSGLLIGVVAFGVLWLYRVGGCVWTIKSEVRRYGLLECRNT